MTTLAPRPGIWRIAALLLVVAAVSLVFMWDVRRGVEHQEDMMVAYGRAIADIVAESSIHNLATFNQWENEINLRLVDNARWLVRLDEVGALTPEVLRDFAATMDLFRILVLDEQGRVEMDNPMPSGSGNGYGNLPRTFLEPLLTGKEKIRSLGYRGAPRKGEVRFAAGAARAGGGAIVVNIQVGQLVASRVEMGPGHLIKALGEGRGLHYVVIQDETGIQAASTDRLAFPFPADDPHLEPLKNGAEWVTREFESALGGVFEVTRIVDLPSGPVLLRVGMDSILLDNMRADIRAHTVLRLGVLVATVVLVSALFLAWQRQRVLDREVVKVTAKLRQREADARRTEKLVAMGSLAAGVAHQIRNPLNSIHMISQVLARNGTLPEAVRDQASHMLTESERIEEIIRQFLQFAKPRRPEFEKVDVAELVQEAVAIQAAAHEGTGLNFSAYAPGLKAEVDARFVTEILENLMKNAAQALGEEGNVLVSLIARGDIAEIVVADDGPGVADEDRDRIFDLYFTTRPEGTGLGLSHVAQMAAAMGGSLTLDSEPGLDGRGARFVVALPLRRPLTERNNPS